MIISSETSIKRCGKCNRRPYCSRECQVIDWNDSKSGQRHKLWCGKAYGEEDEDWEVRPVEHGLGVIALRAIPAHFPIIVERGLETKDDHRGVGDLLPHDASLEEKWELNRMGTLIGKSVLALRIARANHSCNPNASHYYDENNGLKILVANRDITEGEEICISYTNYGDITGDVTVEDHREVLHRKWGITCPSSCFCADPEIMKSIEQAKVLDFAIMDFGRNGNIATAIEVGNDLLEYHRQHSSGHASLTRTYYDLFQICITQRHSLPEGLRFLREAYNLSRQSTGAYSDSTLKYASLLDDPSRHNAFLLFDQQVAGSLVTNPVESTGDIQPEIKSTNRKQTKKQKKKTSNK